MPVIDSHSDNNEEVSVAIWSSTTLLATSHTLRKIAANALHGYECLGAVRITYSHIIIFQISVNMSQG